VNRVDIPLRRGSDAWVWWLSNGDHAYDLVWGGIGGQVTRKAVADLPARYLPVEAQ
jgi:hypothetical protein